VRKVGPGHPEWLPDCCHVVVACQMVSAFWAWCCLSTHQGRCCCVSILARLERACLSSNLTGFTFNLRNLAHRPRSRGCQNDELTVRTAGSESCWRANLRTWSTGRLGNLLYKTAWNSDRRSGCVWAINALGRHLEVCALMHGRDLTSDTPQQGCVEGLNVSLSRPFAHSV
jgi:hypothetical protein